MPGAGAPSTADGIERSTEADVGSIAAAQPAGVPAPTAFTSSGPANDLGFEVMEFVPPDREQPASRPSGFVDDPAGADAGTPAAFVTETMAELYLQQGFHQEALAVYRQLLAQNPNDVGLRDRVAQLESGARSSVGVAEVSDAVFESAQRRRTAPAVRTIRTFLASLAARRVVLRADAEPTESTEAEESAAPAEWSPAPVADAYAPPAREAREEREEREDTRDEPDGGAELPWLSTDEPDEHDEREGAVRADVGEPPAEARDEPREAPSGFPREEPAETRAPRLSGEMGSVNTLFSGAPVTGDDAEAAELLAGAFIAPEGTAAPPPPASGGGRPARAAANELSLDNVFREPGQRTSTEQRRSAFSFDQFFSEGGSGEGGGASNASEEPSPDDIAQFNAWLEGLKKK
jgi:hypothetical protein